MMTGVLKIRDSCMGSRRGSRGWGAAACTAVLGLLIRGDRGLGWAFLFEKVAIFD
jgi:hypothetical protein